MSFWRETTFEAGETVTLSIEPAEGYVLATLSCSPTLGEGEPFSITGSTFTMPEYGVTVSAAFEESEPVVQPIKNLDLSFVLHPSPNVSGYTSENTYTWGDRTFTITNFSNNYWKNWDWIKYGRKTYASVGNIETDQKISSIITKFVLTVDACVPEYVNSIKLFFANSKAKLAESDCDFVVGTMKTGDVEFEIPTAKPRRTSFFDLKSIVQRAQATEIMVSLQSAAWLSGVLTSPKLRNAAP